MQKTFLKSLELTEEAALTKYKLAPLSTRRDIAMLGLVHRTVLGQGPPHFARWFFLAEPAEHKHWTRSRENSHPLQLHDYVDGKHNELLRRSALGVPKVYNKLPKKVVNCKSVKAFQRELQKLVVTELKRGSTAWSTCLSAR